MSTQWNFKYAKQPVMMCQCIKEVLNYASGVKRITLKSHLFNRDLLLKISPENDISTAASSLPFSNDDTCGCVLLLSSGLGH